jgi:hypothetical protein
VSCRFGVTVPAIVAADGVTCDVAPVLTSGPAAAVVKVWSGDATVPAADVATARQ